MEDSAVYDVIVIGSGPGGYVAAIQAARRGLRTAIVERDHPGGICLNWGCIPTKALLKSAEVYRNMHSAASFGLLCGNVGFNLKAIVERSREASTRLGAGVGLLLRKNKVDVIQGEAQLEALGRVRVVSRTADARSYAARHVIVASGASPRPLLGVAFTGNIWSYRNALVPVNIPGSLLIIGAGAIGVEFASFYATFGAKVTLVEQAGHILPAEDAEISARACKAFEKQGIGIRTGMKILALQTHSDGVTATLENVKGERETVVTDAALCAIGVTANTAGLNLEGLGVAMEKGFITVDAYGCTTAAGIYAIGDVTGPPMLAHKAEHEAIVCVDNIAGKNPLPFDREMVPACTYTAPQVASVGLTEKQALEKGWDVQIGRSSFVGNGKAVTLGDADGLVKTVFDRATGRLLGAHMIGAEVTELIHGFVIAMNLETTHEDLMHSIFPHPTLSEAMGESVRNAWGLGINT